jgi:hypothetical protein
VCDAVAMSSSNKKTKESEK